jgi:ABC-type polysaccharide/polyol phosphate export permease
VTLRYGPLWLNLVRKDLRLKYQGSWIGVAWSLVNPLVLLAVYGLTFT